MTDFKNKIEEAYSRIPLWELARWVDDSQIRRKPYRRCSWSNEGYESYKRSFPSEKRQTPNEKFGFQRDKCQSKWLWSKDERQWNTSWALNVLEKRDIMTGNQIIDMILALEKK